METARMDGVRETQDGMDRLLRPGLFHGERHQRLRRVAPLESVGRRRPQESRAGGCRRQMSFHHLAQPLRPDAGATRTQDTDFR